MAKRTPANDDDFGFEPLPSSKSVEDFGFTPEEEEAAEGKMAKSMFPTGKESSRSRQDIGFEPTKDLTPVNVGETLEDIITTLPQGVTTWADEIQAAAQATGKKAFGAEEPWSDIYEKDVSGIREGIGKARERSPWATTAGEMTAGIGSAFVPGLKAITGAGKFAGAPEMVARAAFEGLGTAEDKASMEGLINAGLGGAVGIGGALLSGGLKEVTTVSPNAMRANVLGARTSEFKEIGSREREVIADKLNKIGLFNKNKMDFDVDNMKFVSKGRSLENLEKPTRKILLDRIDNATNKIKAKKEAILGKKINAPVDLDKIKEKLLDSADEFAVKKLGSEEKFLEAEEVKNVIVREIENEMERQGLDFPTVGIIEEVKNKISDKLSNIGKNPLLAKTPDSADIHKKMYATINEYLRDALKMTKYSDLNDTQSMMLTAKTDLLTAIAGEEARTVQAGWGGWGNKILNKTIGSPEAGLGTAKMAEIANMPGLKQAKTPLRMVTEEAPFEAIRFFDPSIPMPSEQVPYRSPQSIGFSPMEIVKFKIPRTSKEIMENKDKVLAKLIQNNANPVFVDAMIEGMNGSPKELSKIIPLLIGEMPTLFVNTDYNVFNNEFLDPEHKAKAADNISKREDLNSIQRAKLINQINKNKVPEGM
jgi:hypothetical protein